MFVLQIPKNKFTEINFSKPPTIAKLGGGDIQNFEILAIEYLIHKQYIDDKIC